MLMRFGVFDHAGNINYHHRFVADDPRVVSRREQRDFARPEFLCATVVHQHVEPAADVILQVGRFAAFGFYDGLDAG